MNAIYSDILKIIGDAETILICSHSSPDGDSVGSQLATHNYISGLGKKVVIVNQGSIPYKYQFLPGVENIQNSDDWKCNLKFDLAVILDCSDTDRIRNVRELIGRDTKIINIDHHSDNSRFGDLALINDKASSVAEMMTELFIGMEITINSDMAMQLFAGIMTDTGQFRFDSTGRRTMEIAGYLIEKGANPRVICDNVYYSAPPDMLKMKGKMIGDARFYEKDKICLMEISRNVMHEYGFSIDDLDGLAEYTMHARGVMVGALLKEVDERETRISLRSRSLIDVSMLAHKFGGGGHPNASGFVFNMPLETSRHKLLENLRGLINAAV